MDKPRTWRDFVCSDVGILILLAAVKVVLHALLTNGQYGFHRDELALLDNARHLEWGFVDYPPLTPFIVRVALTVFGPSLIGLRLTGALAQSAAMLLAGLMARELGGARWAQIIAAVAVAIAPISLAMGALFQYTSFDYLWWVLIAYFTIRLLKSDNPRWWFGIGAAVGLGLLTKYTMVLCAAGIAAGVVLTQARRWLGNPWLWGGAALALLIVLPNLIWQAQHDFISLHFLSDIHARDIRIGRTQGFLIEQLFISTNLVTIPLWVAGLWFYFFSPAGKRYRALGWMFAVPLALFLATQARAYYLAPAYPMLMAAGAVVMERWLAAWPVRRARWVRGLTWGALAVGGVAFAAVALPLAPVNSAWYDAAAEVNDALKEEIGWPELTETVAGIHAGLPAGDRSQAGILAGNYGEAGALNWYGPAYGLPEAISGINSYWLRGYGDPAPRTLIVVGFNRDQAEQLFEACDLAGHITNRYGIKNEETLYHPDLFVCRRLRQPWPEFWPRFKYFG